jgi:hypothetical protein
VGLRPMASRPEPVPQECSNLLFSFPEWEKGLTPLRPSLFGQWHLSFSFCLLGSAGFLLPYPLCLWATAEEAKLGGAVTGVDWSQKGLWKG